jgi:hypothetical protein
MKGYIPSTGFDVAGFLLSPQMFLIYFVVAMLIIIVANPGGNKKSTADKLAEFLGKNVG